MGARVGIDIGGTFTDLLLVAGDGTITVRKVSSTTDDYGRAIVDGLQVLLAEAGVAPSDVSEVLHGTTVATNAILEGKGVPTALVTTEGFRDVLELRRIRIPETYNLFYVKPEPLVPRRLRFEVRERMGPQGQTWVALDMGSVYEAIEAVRRAEVQAVAICFLHSYVNPEHEEIVAAAFRDALPEVFVTHSTEIIAEQSEYERTSTAVINAYVGPLIKTYLASLQDRLTAIGIHGPLLVMQCNGGVMTAEMASRLPAHLVESGPAAGVKAAAQLARAAALTSVITLDMGGTTAKASAIENGQVELTSEYEVGAGINTSSMLVKGGGHPLKIPAIDLSEIGAGGGSIVWIDPGGRLQVGPQSAGAVPGPVCYAAGGSSPTVTDANAVLGFLNPEYLAGGAVPLDTARAEEVLSNEIARPLGLPLLEAAFGVHRLASFNMVRAVKAVSTFRGRDPRGSLLLAFGGNGPVCAAEMARALDMERILVPPAAGLYSAFGLLASSLELQRSQTCLYRAVSKSVGSVQAGFAQLEAVATSILTDSGYPASDLIVRRAADLRYADQGYALTIPVASSVPDIAQMASDFARDHRRTYGHAAEDEPVDIVSLRVTVEVGAGERSVATTRSLATRRANGHKRGERKAYFGAPHGLISTPVLSRADVTATPVAGPAIIEEYDATTVVPPDYLFSTDEWSNIVLQAT